MFENSSEELKAQEQEEYQQHLQELKEKLRTLSQEALIDNYAELVLKNQRITEKLEDAQIKEQESRSIYLSRLQEFKDLYVIRRISSNFANLNIYQIAKLVIDTLFDRLRASKGIIFFLETSILDTYMSLVSTEGLNISEEASQVLDKLLNQELSLNSRKILRCIYDRGTDKELDSAGFALYVEDSGFFWNSIKSGVQFSTKNAFNDVLYNTLYNESDLLQPKLHDDLYEAELERYGLANLGIYQWIPLLSADTKEVLGLIGLDTVINNELEHKFTNIFASEITRIFYELVLNRRLKNSHNELIKITEKLTNLYNINSTLSVVEDRNTLLTKILRHATEMVNAAKGSIMLFDETDTYLETRVICGIPERVAEQIMNKEIKTKTFKRGEGVAGQVAKNKTPLIIQNTSEDRNFINDKEGNFADSILCVPLLVDGDSIGVLNITNKKDNKEFSSEDLATVMQFADQAALAIRNNELYTLAIIDSLTQLFVRRHFFQKFAEETKKSCRSQNPLSILMIDIDHFKSVNDVYGHPCGDHVLKCVASILKQTTREVDIVGRYGGEEFIILLNNSNSDGAKTVAKRIQKHLELATITWDHNGKNIELRISVSIGIASYPEHVKLSALKSLDAIPLSNIKTVTSAELKECEDNQSGGVQIYAGERQAKAKQESEPKKHSDPSTKDDVGEMVSKIVELADMAMYYSKRHGRNRTTIYSDTVRKFIESDASKDMAKKESSSR